MTTSKACITLAIETSIGGGSVAIFSALERIDGFVGASGVSRAEDVLPNIVAMLSRNDIDIESLSEVLVGAGPGSFTGIRIGIATAMGLAAAAQIPVRRFSSLEAIAIAAEISGPFTAALPVGRGMVCVQEFVGNSDRVVHSSDPSPLSNDEFVELAAGDPHRTFVVNDHIFREFDAGIRHGMINIGDDLAGLFARYASHLHEISVPLFIGKAK